VKKGVTSLFLFVISQELSPHRKYLERNDFFFSIWTTIEGLKILDLEGILGWYLET
jgi:hypothetical protein